MSRVMGLIQLRWLSLCLFFALLACSTTQRPETYPPTSQRPPGNQQAAEVVLFAMGLLDTGYTFGGKNPEAGLDCSGLITYVYGQVTNLRISGNAASIASQGKPIARADLRPADIVFFNTRGGPFTHAGIYIGDGKFIHAPNSRGRVQVSQMNSGYFAQRFSAARALLR